jgi:hypothetical protein
VLSVGTLVVGGVACHLGAHGGGCSVPSYGTGRSPSVKQLDKEMLILLVLRPNAIYFWNERG